MIKRETLFQIALLALIAGVFVLFYKMTVPFLAPIVWAVVFTVTAYPLHTRIARRVRIRGLAAFISTLAVAIVILLPLVCLVIAMAGEASVLYDKIQSGEADRIIDAVAERANPFMRELGTRLGGLVDLSDWDFRAFLSQVASRVSGYLGSHVTWGITHTGKVALQFLMMLLSMYYFFKDGGRLLDWVKGSMPLPDEHVGTLVSQVGDVVKATIYGGLVVAALQGAMGGIMFWIMGLPSPILWGFVMGFFALIPLLGAFVVYIPAALVLFAAGSVAKAIILLAVGVGLVSQIDNVLRPILISGRTQIHPLLLFFAIAGGVVVFGFPGLVVGPVIVSVFVALVKVYHMTLRSDPEMTPIPNTPDIIQFEPKPEDTV